LNLLTGSKIIIYPRERQIIVGTSGLTYKSNWVAVLSVLSVTLIRYLLDPWLGDHSPLMLYLLAVIASAWFGGFKQALAASLLSVLIASYLFIPPRGEFHFPSSSDQLRLVIFLLEAVLICLIIDKLHKASLGAKAQAAQLRRHEKELIDTQNRLKKHNAAIIELSSIPPSNDYTLSSYLRQIIEVSSRTLELERVSLWLFTEDRSCIQCVDLFERNLNRHSSGQVLCASKYERYFEALVTERTIAASDARNDIRTKEFAEDYLLPNGITSMLDAQVHLSGSVVGVICHEHVGRIRIWSPDEQAFAASIADLVALAIETHERRKIELDLTLNEESPAGCKNGCMGSQSEDSCLHFR
jgi:hypothetical protein